MKDARTSCLLFDPDKNVYLFDIKLYLALELALVDRVDPPGEAFKKFNLGGELVSLLTPTTFDLGM
jgi:hypothetical protein